MSSCPNKDFLKKYAIKCELIDNKIKCPSKKKIKQSMSQMFLFSYCQMSQKILCFALYVSVW